MKKLLPFAALAVLAGCPTEGGDCDSGEELDTAGNCVPADTDTDTDTDTQGEFSVAEGFDAASYSIDLTNVPEGTTGFALGLAETGAAAGAEWFGEDCLNGTGSTQICHEFTGTSGTLSSVDSIGAVSAGQTTLFDGDTDGQGDAYTAAGDDRLTYYVELIPSGDCYVFGEDASYYSTFGCTVLN